jgi:hypothetical protein
VEVIVKERRKRAVIRSVLDAKMRLVPREEPLPPGEPLSEKQQVTCPIFPATVSPDILARISEFLPERFRW